MNCLHVCLRCSFVVLVMSSFICCRAREVGSLALIFSNISAGTGPVLIRCRPEGIWCDAAFRIMVRKIFLLFDSKMETVFCSTWPISLRYRSQFAFFRLKRVRWGIGLIVKSISKRIRIGRWCDHRFVFVCQLVEVIKRG